MNAILEGFSATNDIIFRLLGTTFMFVHEIIRIMKLYHLLILIALLYSLDAQLAGLYLKLY